MTPERIVREGFAMVKQAVALVGQAIGIRGSHVRKVLSFAIDVVIAATSNA